MKFDWSIWFGIIVQPAGTPEVLKLASWDVFFGDMLKFCKEQVADSPEFFGSLSNLILTKLVKAVPMSKPISAETTAFLRTFLDSLAKNASATGQGVDHEETLQCLASVLNFGAAPGLLIRDSDADIWYDMTW